MQKADRSEAIGIEEQMNNIVKEWEALIKEYPRLRYSGTSKQFESLLVQYDDRNKPKNQGRWPTLNSVRDVDAEIAIEIWGEERL
jgi:hypothetical protein